LFQLETVEGGKLNKARTSMQLCVSVFVCLN